MKDKKKDKKGKTDHKQVSSGSTLKKRNIEILDAGESQEDIRCLGKDTD